MLECQHRTTDQWLAELISEVGCTVRSFCQDLLWRLIQPLAYGQNVLPITCSSLVVVQTGIGRHINSRSCDWPASYTTTHTVADFTARTSSSTIEGFYRGGEVVCLGL